MTPAYDNHRKWQPALVCLPACRTLLTLLVISLAGCASQPGPLADTWSAPAQPVTLVAHAWHFADTPGTLLRAPHYELYTTLADPLLIDRLAQTLEGALIQYQRLAPDAPPTTRPLICYIFKDRSQWARFTRQTTGADARVYLQIIRGGYTVGDRFVAYEVGTASTVSVIAHEGWHQFGARHFKGHLPPFLEEGIACLFESVAWKDHRPLWNLSVNPSRRDQLRNAIQTHTLWPLDKLITLHAGAIVDQPRSKIEAFYAQSWAFARFLREADAGKYRPALRRLLAGAAAARLHDPTGSLNRDNGLWNPRGVQPLLEHELGMPLSQIERAYLKFVHQITDERAP